MPKYLIRRRNQWGRWVHLATYTEEPNERDIRHSFGSGEYEILIAQEGVIGLRKVKTIDVPWELEHLEEMDAEPTAEYISKKYGHGNYFVLKSCHAVPIQVYPEDQPHDVTWQNLQDGASVMRKISIIYRVKMPWA